MIFMKTIQNVGLALLIVGIAFSCKKASSEEAVDAANSKKVAVADSTSVNDAVASSAAVENTKSNKQFIRTADIKFKVKNVPKSTYIIENATSKFGGYVAYTNLQSTISDKETTKVSQDSTLETTRYTVENNITIRVPNVRLDTVIKTIAKQIDFLDYRIIKADDVSLQILSNQMAQNRSTNSGNRLEKAIDEKGQKIKDIVAAEANLDDKNEQKDNAKLENLSLKDQVNFSTLTLQIYQRESLKEEMIANVKTNRQNIGSKILDSLKTGWILLEEIIAFVVQLWSLILIALVAVFVYRKYFKK
jgi:Domain of unknown function (DUF4349)